MKILFDTNIILDVLLAREPFFETCASLSDAVEAKVIEGYLCATTITTVDYFLTKYLNKSVSRDALKKLLALYSIAEVNKSILEKATSSDFTDFEDAVLYYSGDNVGVHGIVTRNPNDFKTAQLPIYQPVDLQNIIKNNLP